MTNPKYTPKYEGIMINHLGGKDVSGLLCVVCEERGVAYPELAEISLADFGFYLCPDHEAKLLSTLLANYLRRLRRGRRLPILRKEEEKPEVKLLTS